MLSDLLKYICCPLFQIQEEESISYHSGSSQIHQILSVQADSSKYPWKKQSLHFGDSKESAAECPCIFFSLPESSMKSKTSSVSWVVQLPLTLRMPDPGIHAALDTLFRLPLFKTLILIFCTTLNRNPEVEIIWHIFQGDIFLSFIILKEHKLCEDTVGP